jgi:hypothetical protein
MMVDHDVTERFEILGVVHLGWFDNNQLFIQRMEVDEATN